MRTLFSSWPWDSRRGHDISGRVWLPRLLIVAALLLSVYSGVWTARGHLVRPLYLLGVGIGFGVLLVRPDLALFLIPIGISYPRTIPRLFGSIGIMELLLPLAGVAWVSNVVLYHRRIWMNQVLGLALLTAVPIVGSAVAGRGDQDWARVLMWLSGCGMYLLAFNLVHDRRTAERILLWAALVIVGVTCLDFLTHGWLSDIQDPSRVLSPELVYRHTAVGAGQNNYVAAVVVAVMPILVAYALLAEDRLQRRVSVVGVILGVLLGVLMLARRFWVNMAIALVPQMYVIWKMRGRRYVPVTLLLIGASVGLASLLVPTMADLSRGRFEDSVASRMELSLIQLRWAIRSPLWGYGSNRISSRFAHAMIPTALYDYGLIFTLPLFGVLGMWLRQAIRLVRETDHGRGSAFSVAHLGAAAGIVGSAISQDFLITNTVYLCLAFLIAGSLGAVLSVQERDAVSEG